MLDKLKNRGIQTQYLRNINVRWFRFDLRDLQTLLLLPDELKALSIKDGDLLICEGGEPGRCAVWRQGTNNLTYQKALHRVRLRGDAIPEFFMYQLASDAATGRLTDAFTGTTIKHLTGESLKKYPVRVAPAAEQRRIVAKLQALFRRVDSCRDRLQQVPSILKRFREAVLEAAVSGRLTEEWRRERHISRSWEHVRLQEVATARLGKMLDAAKNRGESTRYLRNLNVRWFDFNLSDVQELRVTSIERQELAIRAGDVLVCEGGEPGRCAVWRGPDDQYVYQKALHRVRAGPRIEPEWICYALKNAADSGALSDLLTGTTIKHLPGIALSKFAFSLPPLEEQKAAIRTVNQLFVAASGIDNRVARELSRCNALAGALLEKVLRGELVRQDPEDEPASMMLERINARQEALEPSEVRQPLGSVRGKGRGKRAVVVGREARERKRA